MIGLIDYLIYCLEDLLLFLQFLAFLIVGNINNINAFWLTPLSYERRALNPLAFKVIHTRQIIFIFIIDSKSVSESIVVININ